MTPPQLNPQLHPLQIHPETGQPYLPLKSHNNIILTTLRRSDIPQILEYLNDWRIAQWFDGPPYPYLEEHADIWLDRLIPPVNQLLQDLEAAREKSELLHAGCMPLQAIREVGDGGNEGGRLIGYIGVFRCESMELETPGKVDWEAGKRRQEQNDALPAGHPDILWSIAYWLSPEHHGKGIMSEAISIVIKEWAIPRMNVRKMLASAFSGNSGSVKVLEKNGFRLRERHESYANVKGRLLGLDVLEWNEVT